MPWSGNYPPDILEMRRRAIAIQNQREAERLAQKKEETIIERLRKGKEHLRSLIQKNK